MKNNIKEKEIKLLQHPSFLGCCFSFEIIKTNDKERRGKFL